MDWLRYCWVFLRDGPPYDPGYLEKGPAFWLDWADWTASYCGEPYEYARRVPNQPTTREIEAAQDAAIVAAREARVEARRRAEAQAHRPVPFRQRRA